MSYKKNTVRDLGCSHAPSCEIGVRGVFRLRTRRSLHLPTSLLAYLTFLGALGASPFPKASHLDDPRQPASATAQLSGEPTTEDSATAGTPPADATLLPALIGVRLIDSESALQPSPVADPTGLSFENLSCFDEPGLRLLIQPFLGRPVTLASLQSLCRALVVLARGRDHPVVDVYAPPQDISGGTVQLVVLIGKLGAVHVEGARHFPASRYKSGINKVGRPIVASSLIADMALLNRNPFRTVEGVFTAGGRPGETDLILNVRDRSPWRLFGGYDNRGSTLTGRDRWFTGFNLGNAWGLDHQLNYRYTTDHTLQGLRSHSLSYGVPWAKTHQFTTLLAGFTATEAPVSTFFDLRGESSQLGLRHEFILPAPSRGERTITLGLDFKRSDSDLDFGGTSVFATENKIAQASLGYTWQQPDRWGHTRLVNTVVLSPGDLVSGNDDAAFQSARDGAKATYAYVTVELERSTRLPGQFSLFTRGQLAYSDQRLLSGEQISLGGADSVRGYTENAYSGDLGFWGSNELRTPLRTLPSGFSLQPFLFLDAGWAWKNRPANELARARLASAGLGLRLFRGEHFSATLDQGWQLLSADNLHQPDRYRLNLTTTFSW